MPVRKSVPLTYWLEDRSRYAVFKRRHVPLQSIGDHSAMRVKIKLAPRKTLPQTY